MYFYVIQTVFKPFKNHKNQRSQIMLDFILKIYNQNSLLYIIIYFYVIYTVFKPFKNHKNQRSHIMMDFILKIYNLLNIKPDRYFLSSKYLSYIYNYVFLCYLDCFQIFKNHKNQRSQIMLDFILKIYNLLNIKPDRYFLSSKYLSYI